MNNLTNIIQIIRENETPYIQLWTKDVMRNSLAGKYDCKNCSAEDDKVEKAIEWLISYTQYFPANTVFVLQASKTSTSNGTGIIGPFVFTATSDSSVSGLGTIQNPNALNSDYIHKSEIAKAVAELQLNFERQLMESKLERLQEQYEAAIENIQAAASNWSPQAIQGLVGQLAAGYSLLSGKPLPAILPNLSKGIGDIQEEEKENNDESIFSKKINTELSGMTEADKAKVLQIINKIKNVNDGKKTNKTGSDQLPENTERTDA